MFLFVVVVIFELELKQYYTIVAMPTSIAKLALAQAQAIPTTLDYLVILNIEYSMLICISKKYKYVLILQAMF